MNSKTNRGLRVINYKAFYNVGMTGAATAEFIRQLEGANMVLTLSPDMENVTV